MFSVRALDTVARVAGALDAFAESVEGSGESTKSSQRGPRVSMALTNHGDHNRSIARLARVLSKWNNGDT